MQNYKTCVTDPENKICKQLQHYDDPALVYSDDLLASKYKTTTDILYKIEGGSHVNKIYTFKWNTLKY